VHHVIFVAKQQLKGVGAERKSHSCFRFAPTEAQVMKVIGDWLIRRRQRGVNQEMVITRI
jgi:hypothetical protein